MDPPGKTPPGIIRYLVRYFSFKLAVSLANRTIPDLQPKVTIPIPKDHFCFYFFIHNKDQMYLPKIDQTFGSYYLYLDTSKKLKGNGTCLAKQYKLERTHWKTLDKERNRCDEGNVNIRLKSKWADRDTFCQLSP